MTLEDLQLFQYYNIKGYQNEAISDTFSDEADQTTNDGVIVDSGQE